MNKQTEDKIKILFRNLCCSICKNEFDEESISVIRKEKGLLSVNLSCKYCGKDFGTTFIGLTNQNIKSEPVIVQEGPMPIDSDDVLDAHLFIKELDETWQKYLPDGDNSN